MNYYLDFEATRFSNRIISIGCVAETGETFSTLVKPVNKAKVDKFITELTGITNEMLETAPTADAAFLDLYHFIMETCTDGAPPTYYAYGNSDADFIRHTIKYMTNPISCICAQAIQGNLVDYAETVKKFFGAKSDLALRKIYMLIKSQQEFVQNHDALEDAKMLQTVVEQLHNKCKPADKNIILNMASQKKPQLNGAVKSAPPIFIEWNNYSKWESPTGADENDWVIKMVDQHAKDKPMYFKDLDTAALWIIKFVARNMSPKKEEHIERVKRAIVKSNSDNRCRYNCYWTVKGD